MSGYNFQKYCILVSGDLSLPYSVDPDETQHYTAYHLGLHSLQSTCLVGSKIQRIKFV